MDEWRAEGSRSGPDRERGRRERGDEERSFDRPVFGERDSGMGYNRPAREMRPDYSSDYRVSDDEGPPAWQDRDYQGVSPAFRQHERDYEAGHRDQGPGRYGAERGDPRDDFEARAREAGDYVRRQGRKVASWFSDVAGEGSEAARREQTGARGLGPRGYKRSDERITEDVHHGLAEDRWLDASDIDVTVKDGEVTLSGTVANRDAKHHAEHLVEDLPGVTHVQNNLRARAAGYRPPAAWGAGDGVVRSEGDGAMETSANADHTTTRKP